MNVVVADRGGGDDDDDDDDEDVEYFVDVRIRSSPNRRRDEMERHGGEGQIDIAVDVTSFFVGTEKENAFANGIDDSLVGWRVPVDRVSTTIFFIMVADYYFLFFMLLFECVSYDFVFTPIIILIFG